MKGTSSSSTKSTDPTPPVKRLQRLPAQGKIAGVCAGLADYLDVDVTILRIIFVVLTLASGGFGIIVYIVLALMMPIGNQPLSAQFSAKNLEENITALGRELETNGSSHRLRNYFGVCLILFGLWFLLLQLFPEWIDFNWGIIWPVLLVFLGLALLVKGRK